MATHLRPSDVPQPWFTKKKPVTKSGRKRKARTSVSQVNDYSTEPVSKEHGKRKKKEKTMSATTMQGLIGIPKRAVPDEEELSQKREKDAVACGRTVRTVWTHEKQTYAPVAVRSESAEEDCENNAGMAVLPGGQPSSPRLTRTTTRTEAEKEVKENVRESRRNGSGKRSSLSQRPGNEPIGVGEERTVQNPQRMHSTVQRKPNQVYSHSDSDCAEQYENIALTNRRTTLSPSAMYSHEWQGGEAKQREVAEQGWQSHRKHVLESSTSPGKNWSSHNHKVDSDNRGRSTSRSPVYGRQSRYHRRLQRCKEYKGDGPRDERFQTEDECREYRRKCRGDHHNDWRYESSSPESGLWRRRMPSIERRHERRRYLTPLSSVSPPKISPIENCTQEENCVLATSRKGDSLGTSAPLGRSQRRHRQASREAKKAKRERAGKKAFYLTVDVDGKPYGTGKPAWMAEINKLAVGLDPSCTHVRKQTFEDVQTFKDRLNESFEYSERLNEEYLRGLMGKAVTKKRRELITLIRNNGKQPLHIDQHVWHRLQKLAYSKQWEERSEQGRHANACRKSVGRTGSIGENGVRQNLHLRLGRSPDPDEVQEEMHRDKGYGRRRERLCTIHPNKERNVVEVSNSEEDMQSADHGGIESPPFIERGGGQTQKTKSGKRAEDSIREAQMGRILSTTVHTRYTRPETKNMSTNEYIQMLEAEIKRLQACEAKTFTGNGESRIGSQGHVLENGIESL